MQQQLWRWVSRNPVNGRLRTEGRPPGREALRDAGAMRVPDGGLRPRFTDDPQDFQDTQADAFRTTSANDD